MGKRWTAKAEAEIAARTAKAMDAYWNGDDAAYKAAVEAAERVIDDPKSAAPLPPNNWP